MPHYFGGPFSHFYLKNNILEISIKKNLLVNHLYLKIAAALCVTIFSEDWLDVDIQRHL